MGQWDNKCEYNEKMQAEILFLEWLRGGVGGPGLLKCPSFAGHRGKLGPPTDRALYSLCAVVKYFNIKITLLLVIHDRTPAKIIQLLRVSSSLYS